MCTISFVNHNNLKILTFNRDEDSSKPASSPFQSITFKDKHLIAPIEPLKKGTWFVVSPSGEFAVLFNGAEKSHISKPPYLKSRGIILLELFSENSMQQSWEKIELNRIEPFSIIHFNNDELLKFQWNGKKKNVEQLNIEQNHIWSSSTLYAPTIQKNRELFFQNYMETTTQILANDIFNLHQSDFLAHQPLGAIYEQKPNIHTKSISQLVLNSSEIKLKHLDLINHQLSIYNLSIQ